MMTLNTLHDKIKELSASADRLQGRDKEFANSLCNQYFQRGFLSEKQQYWVGEMLKKCGQQSADYKSENDAAYLEVFDGKIVHTILTEASKQLKFPKLRYQTDNGRKIVFHLASTETKSKWLGTIFIDNGLKAESKARYGTIDRNGHGYLRRESDQEIKTAIRKIATDPTGIAKLQGQKYSFCCFCGLGLINKSSVYHGYGPICAGNWGLPWGDTGDTKDEEEAAAAELKHIQLVDLE